MLAPCAFTDQVVGEVYIAPKAAHAAVTVEAEVQTAAFTSAEEGTQTALSALQVISQLDKAVGTEPHRAMQATFQGLQYVYGGINYDVDKLATFLEQHKDSVLAVLQSNAHSTVFDHYEPAWTSTTQSSLSVAFTLSAPHALESELHALDLSWSATGTLLAVAYGRLDTSGWCDRGGIVAVWNLVRADLDPSAPHYTLELDSYATCLAFHPVQGPMLAVGSYSGEIVLYHNVTEQTTATATTSEQSNEKEGTTRKTTTTAMVVSTRHGAWAHREPITHLQWVQSMQELREAYRYVLVSCSQDGTIAMWSPANALLVPLARYEVQNRRHVRAGITSLAYSLQQQQQHALAHGEAAAQVASLQAGVVLIGLESGELGCGRTDNVTTANLTPTTTTTTRNKLAKKDDDSSDDSDKKAQADAVPQPIPLELDWLAGHRGPVQSIAASPFFRHLFLTCSSDGSAHLCSDLDRDPLLSLEPTLETRHFLYACAFSPSRPSVIALGSRSGSLYVYDIQSSPARPAHVVEAAAGPGAAVVALRFNPSVNALLATGDTQGLVRVWRLPTALTQCTEAERAATRTTAMALTTSKGSSGKGKSDKGTARGADLEQDAMRRLFGFAMQ